MVGVLIRQILDTLGLLFCMIWVACATFGTIGTTGVKYGAGVWRGAIGGVGDEWDWRARGGFALEIGGFSGASEE